MNANNNMMQNAVLRALEEETKRIVNEEAEKAATRVQERVRAMTGQIAATVAKSVSYEYEPLGNRLLITVHFPQGSMERGIR